MSTKKTSKKSNNTEKRRASTKTGKPVGSQRVRGKTLVTGAAGFIGSHVVRELLKEGREVRALVMPGENRKNLEALDVEIVEGNLLEPSTLKPAVTGCSRIHHLAAIYAIWLPRREKMFEVNCIGSLNLLWEAYHQSVEKLVFTSSIAAVGIKPGKTPAKEDDRFNQVAAANDYVNSKWLSEEEAKTFVRQGMDISFCNPGFPFGARDVAPTPTGQILLDIVNGKNRFYFDAGFSAVDVEDVARGHVLAEKHGKPGERYILSNHNLTFKEFYDLISDVSGVRHKARKLPIQFAAPLGDWLERRADQTGKRPVLTGSGIRYANNYLYFDNSKARNELGLTFTPIEDSIRRAISWFAENRYITNQEFLRRYRNC
ncbi:MAG: SDR family oxidoreductase [Chrysiogenetes bacterium]|nr:SDR family oxidoreductase [Chrysiogenetes bacterium]